MPDTPDQQWSNGSWRVLSVAVEPRIQKDLTALLRATLPSAPMQELASYPDAKELNQALSTHQPNVCFVDVSANSETGLSLVNFINKLDPTIGVVALLQSNNPELILKSLRSGASEFMLAPLSDDQLHGALNKLLRVLPKSKTDPRTCGKTIAVLPAKGACGATTIAACLAFQVKRLGHQRVLLADMDPLAGTIPFVLKVKCAYSFMDVLTRGSDLDQDLWKAMVTTRENIDVLLSPETITEAAMDLEDPRPILDYARNNYDVVVLDAGTAYGPWNAAQARHADEVLLVTTNELPALRGALRALSYFEANGINPEKVRIVVNRFSRDIGLSREVIATALNTDAFEVVPSDYETIQKSLFDGRPVASSTGVGKAIGHIAEKLVGRKTDSGAKDKKRVKSASSPLASLLSLFGR
jgi:pilus assembly protein CpaE